MAKKKWTQNDLHKVTAESGQSYLCVQTSWDGHQSSDAKGIIRASIYSLNKHLPSQSYHKILYSLLELLENRVGSLAVTVELWGKMCSMGEMDSKPPNMQFMT